MTAADAAVTPEHFETAVYRMGISLFLPQRDIANAIVGQH